MITINFSQYIVPGPVRNVGGGDSEEICARSQEPGACYEDLSFTIMIGFVMS